MKKKIYISLMALWGLAGIALIVYGIILLNS